MGITNISSIEIKNCIIDELHVRERRDVNLSSQKEIWQVDTYILAQFFGNLEAGIINNNGITITQFTIKRRKKNELNSITLGHLPFVNNQDVIYKDYTQANDDYIYSIVPIGENELEGKPNDIEVKNDFAGWWIVDKNNSDNIIPFDKFIGSEGDVSIQPNQGRVVIETLSQFPTIYKTKKYYNTFSLQAVIYNENNSSAKEYQKIVDMVNSNIPFIAKGGNGSLYVVEISNPRSSSPQNVYRGGRDYFTVTLDCTEIMTEKEYHEMFQD